MLIRTLLSVIVLTWSHQATAVTSEPDTPIPFNSAWALNITLNDLQTSEEICPLAALDLGTAVSPLTLGYIYDGQNIDIYTGGRLGGSKRERMEPGSLMYLIGAVGWLGMQRRRHQGGDK